MRFMKITKQQWQKWASDYASRSADDFAKHAKNLTLEQHIILKAKIERAALYGIELTATIIKHGADICEAEDIKAALMQTGADTVTVKLEARHPATDYERIMALSTALRDCINLFLDADNQPEHKSLICTGDRREMWEEVLRKHGST